jgi:hypothetical protein
MCLVHVVDHCAVRALESFLNIDEFIIGWWVTPNMRAKEGETGTLQEASPPSLCKCNSISKKLFWRI